MDKINRLALADDVQTSLGKADTALQPGAISFTDANFSLVDNVDATKTAKFELSGVGTATTITLTVPNGSGTILLDLPTQTLFNKNIGNTNILTVRDDRFTMQDNADTTKQMVFDLSLISTATTRTVQWPNAGGVVILDTATQVLTNKTFSGGSFSGAIDISAASLKTAGLNIGPTTATNIQLELGQQVGGSSTLTTIDFHTGATVVDYDTRIETSGGNGGSAGGTMTFRASALKWGTANILTDNYSGNVTIGGSVTITDATNGLVIRPPTGSAPIQLGRVDGTATTCIIDFNTSATVVDYDTRIIATGGTGAIGGGTLNFQTGALQLNGVAVPTISSSSDFTNKTLATGSVTFRDSTDATKKLAFDLTAFSTGTTRSLILPNQNVTISTFGASIIDDADATAVRTTISAQASDATLTALAGMTTANGQFIRSTAADAFTPTDMVGTVSQSGGVPTGSIIESGSNANGRYRKWADGTMICDFTDGGITGCSTAEGALFANAAASTWTFPAAFVDTNVVVTGVGGALTRFLYIGNPTATTVNYKQLATVSNAGTVASRLQAIGRWF